NEKLPSEPELMKKYNVSNTTLHKTKSELMSEGVIYSIQGKGCFVSGSREEPDTSKQTISNKRIIFTKGT
ncbi:MAG: winged helix-turn-helix domain-containing protein, partial [Candidatus Asgardarchaeia archaeon]